MNVYLNFLSHDFRQGHMRFLTLVKITHVMLSSLFDISQLISYDEFIACLAMLSYTVQLKCNVVSTRETHASDT